MGELFTVGERITIEYQGIFSAQELVTVIKDWCSDSGYWFFEKRHSETTKQEGKYMDLDIMIVKKLTDYAKSFLNMRIQYLDYKDVVVEIDNKKKKLQDGKVTIWIDPALNTDYEGQWDSKPIYYVLRVIFEKYLYTPFMSGFEKTIHKDAGILSSNIKSYLNMEKWKETKMP